MKTQALVVFQEPTTFYILGSSVDGTQAQLLTHSCNDSSVMIDDDYASFAIRDNGGGLRLVDSYQAASASCDGSISLLSPQQFKVWYAERVKDEDDEHDLSDCDILLVRDCTGVDIAIVGEATPFLESEYCCNDFDLQSDTPIMWQNGNAQNHADNGAEVTLFLRDGKYTKLTIQQAKEHFALPTIPHSMQEDINFNVQS